MTLTALLAAVTMRRAFAVLPLAALGVAGACAYFTYVERRDFRSGAHMLVRSFYGSLRTLDMRPPDVPEASDSSSTARSFTASKRLAPELRTTPTAYYGPTSGVGLALQTMTHAGRRIGMIGLGAGTIATYGRAGDVVRFYEINPQVVNVARGEFSFLGDSAATSRSRSATRGSASRVSRRRRSISWPSMRSPATRFPSTCSHRKRWPSTCGT